MDRTRRYRPILRLLALVASLGMLALMAPTVGLSAALGPQAGSRLSSTVDGAPAAPAGAGAARASLIGDPALARITDVGSVEAVLAQAIVADMALAKSGPAAATTGTAFTYTLTVSNIGPGNATSGTVTDQLPAGLTIGTITPSQGTCGQTGGLVTCTIGTLNAGSFMTISIQVTPQASLAGSTITNTATVSLTSVNETDPNSANNTGSATTLIVGPGTPAVTPSTASADLALTKTAPAAGVVGTNIAYNLTVTNNGPGIATSVTATDLLAGGLTFVSAQPSQGTCSTSGQLVTCSLGTLNAAGTATIAITVTPQASLAGATITNTASVSGAQPDPNPGNNTGAATTSFSAAGTATATPPPTTPADLSLTKSGSPNPAVVGGNITYTLVVTNLGPGTATGVNLVDGISTGVTFVSATSTQGTCSQANNVTTCSIGTIAPNVAVTVTEVVTVTAAVSGGAVSNTAVVGGQQPDPNQANNSASANIAISGVVGATPTPTGVLSPTPTSVVVPPGQSPPATSGQPGVPCTTQIGGTCSVTGAVTGTFTKIGSMTFNVTATGPTTSAPRGVPAVFIPTTVGVESFGCTALPLTAPFVATCTGTTRGDLLQGAIVTVRFPLTGGGTQDVTGTVTTGAAIAPNVQQAIALVRPSGVERIPCADSIGQTCNVAGAVNGSGAVTGSMTWTLTANVPAGTVAGTVPVVVFSTTAGLEGFPCSPVGAGATTVACTVTTVGNAIIGSNVTVVFTAGVTSVGTVSGPGPAALAALGSAPLLPPFPPPFPPLPPPPGLLLPPPDPSAGLALPLSSMVMTPSYAGVPVVPEADSLVLLAGGLVAVGAVAAQRWWRRRWDD